jgi:SAM-dependent methyltransferase
MTTQRSALSPKTCPVCNSGSRSLFKKQSYAIRTCHVCHHQFAEILPNPEHIDQVYNNDYFHGGSQRLSGYFDYFGEGKFLRQKGSNYAKLMQRYAKKGRRLLDVGSAAGFILQGFLDRSWTGYGIEPNLQMVEYGRSLKIPVEPASLTELCTDELFDLVLMIQVAAHLTDLQSSFAKVANQIQPNGFWLIETGDRNSLSARLRGQHWQAYHPPELLHWFSRSDLQRMVAQFGFREVAWGRPRRWVNGAHLKFDLDQRSQDSAIAKLGSGLAGIVPNHLPLRFPAMDQFWVLYQKVW